MAVVVFQKVNPQAQTQGQVFALREHRINSVRRRGEFFEHRHQLPAVDFGFNFPRAAPCNAVTCQAPIVQHLAHLSNP